MSSRLKCVLCCKICNGEYKNLYNNSGESNNVYAMVAKYFDPMLLFATINVSSWICAKVLCDICWNRINDFYEFQQYVLKAQTELIEEQNDIKCENEITYDEECIIKQEHSDDCNPIKEKSSNPIVVEILNKEPESPAIEARCKSKEINTTTSNIEEELQAKEQNQVDTSNINDDSYNFPEHSIIVTQYLDPILTSNNNTINPADDDHVNNDDDAHDDNEKLSVELIGNKPPMISKSLNKDENVTSDLKLSHTRKRRKTTTELNEANITRKLRSATNSNAHKSNPKKATYNTLRKKTTTELNETNRTKKLRSATNSKAHKSDPKKVTNKTLEKTREIDAFIAQHRPELECTICNVKVSNFFNLRTHFHQIHQTQCYVLCCGKPFFRRCKFVDHLRLHVNPNLYKCEICGRASSSKYNLILHKQKVHNTAKKQYKCEICHRMFNQKPSMERHKATHTKGNKDFVCKECGKAYVLEIQLKTHIKAVHRFKLMCDKCGKTLHGIGNLRQHLREHAGTKQAKWPCNVCGTVLMTRSSLRHHNLSYHHDGSVAYVCKDCGKVTTNERALLLHKRNVHEAVRKYQCIYCIKAFKKNKALQEHIATHTGQDLYKCPYCSKTFKVSSNMHHHKKRAHPTEWAKARQNRVQLPKLNLNMIKKQVIM